MTCCSNSLGIGITTKTCKCCFSFAITGRLYGYLLCILMSTSGLNPRTVNVLVCTTKTSVIRNKTQVMDRYSIICNIRTALFCLICDSLSTGIKLNFCAVLSSNASTGCSYVYISFRCINLTSDMYCCITRCCMCINSTRCIWQQLHIFISINVTLTIPFGCVVNVNAVSATQNTLCAPVNDKLCAGKQSNVLCNINLRVVAYMNCDITVNRKNVLRGVYSFSTK